MMDRPIAFPTKLDTGFILLNLVKLLIRKKL